MSLKSLGQSVFCVLACLCLASCNFVTNSKTLSGKSAAASTSAVKRSDAFDQYAATIRDHLNNERYAELEAAGSHLHVSKERLPGGAWKLNAFYSGVNEPLLGDRADESEWQVLINRLRKWTKEKPGSITARVGLSDALVNHAWKARGQGFADSVSPAGWGEFEARTALAERELNEAEKLDAKCPHLYVTKLRIGLGQGWEFDRFERVFQEGVRLEPTYYYLYRVKAMYLMPRWYGEAGDWETFANETYQRLGGKDGAMLYYLIASHLRTFYGMSFFEKNRVSWPKMREGFNELDHAFGVSNERLNEACLLAALASDHETAQVLFERIGDNADLSVWKLRSNFDGYRAWANHKTKEEPKYRRQNLPSRSDAPH